MSWLAIVRVFLCTANDVHAVLDDDALVDSSPPYEGVLPLGKTACSQLDHCEARGASSALSH
eukprot:2765323-Amphidinium_carterae.1